MDNFRLGEIIAEMFKEEEIKHFGLVVVHSEYDEFDGSVGLVIRDNGKNKRYIIDVKEV